MRIRTAWSLVALACPALSLAAFAAPASSRANELTGQLQALRTRINQEAAKSESGLTAAQLSALKGRVARAAPEVSRIRADIRTLAAKLHVTLSPGSAEVLASTRGNLLSQMDAAADSMIELFMQQNVEDPEKKEDAELVMKALHDRLLRVFNGILVTPTPTPHLSPRPSHE